MSIKEARIMAKWILKHTRPSRWWSKHEPMFVPGDSLSVFNGKKEHLFTINFGSRNTVLEIE